MLQTKHKNNSEEKLATNEFTFFVINFSFNNAQE